MIKKAGKTTVPCYLPTNSRIFDSNVFPFREVGFKRFTLTVTTIFFISPACTLVWTEHIKTPHGNSSPCPAMMTNIRFQPKGHFDQKQRWRTLGNKNLLTFLNTLNTWLMRCCSLLSRICLRLWKCHPVGLCISVVVSFHRRNSIAIRRQLWAHCYGDER